MANRMVHVSARKAAKKKTGHKVHHMTITPAENGFSAETHMSPPEPSKPGEYMQPEPETKVFMNHKQLGKHVASTFGPPDQEEAGETPGQEAGEDEGAE